MKKIGDSELTYHMHAGIENWSRAMVLCIEQTVRTGVVAQW